MSYPQDQHLSKSEILLVDMKKQKICQSNILEIYDQDENYYGFYSDHDLNIDHDWGCDLNNVYAGRNNHNLYRCFVC